VDIDSGNQTIRCYALDPQTFAADLSQNLSDSLVTFESETNPLQVQLSLSPQRVFDRNENRGARVFETYGKEGQREFETNNLEGIRVYETYEISPQRVFETLTWEGVRVFETILKYLINYPSGFITSKENQTTSLENTKTLNQVVANCPSKWSLDHLLQSVHSTKKRTELYQKGITETTWIANLLQVMGSNSVKDPIAVTIANCMTQPHCEDTDLQELAAAPPRQLAKYIYYQSDPFNYLAEGELESWPAWERAMGTVSKTKLKQLKKYLSI
jgi:hypothetical protein